MNYQKVKEFCEDNGFTSRKQRYEIMEKMFGVSAETCKKMMSVDRQLRDVFPVDEVGIKKAKEWEKSEQIHKFESDRLFNLRPIL